MRKTAIDAIFPKTRQTVLSACLLRPEKWWYLSDLANYLKVTPSTLQRELASLAESDLLETRKDGNRVYYKANISHPIVPDLQSLLIKTIGVTEAIRSALEKFMPKIKTAFIYGSVARAKELSTSDVDIMVIGNVKLADLAINLRKVESTIGREINPVLYTPDEFSEKQKGRDSFLKTVVKNKKIFLKGGELELKALAK
jgi:predicted nucleotidyltransferase